MARNVDSDIEVVTEPCKDRADFVYRIIIVFSNTMRFDKGIEADKVYSQTLNCLGQFSFELALFAFSTIAHN